MKKSILILILFILTGCSKQLGANLPLLEAQKIDTELKSVDTIETNSLSTKGKYKFIPKYTKDNYEFEIHEYVMPDGSKGYTKFIRKIENGKVYEKNITSGKLGKYRSHDWMLRPDMYANKNGKIQINSDL